MLAARLRPLQALSYLTIAAALLIGLVACAPKQQGSNRRISPTNAAGATDLLSEVRKRGKLLISTDANYQPLSYKSPDGGWHGFDIDVGRDIARRLGVQAEFLW